MSKTTPLSRPQLLGRLELLRLTVNQACSRLARASEAESADFETALVYAISAKESLDCAIAQMSEMRSHYLVVEWNSYARRLSGRHPKKSEVRS